MKLIKDKKTEEHQIYKNPPMFCFGGFNPAIEIDKIKSLRALYWYGNNNSDSIPVLMIELIDGTKISIDYETAEEAKKAIKEFQKKCKIKVLKGF